ncbi:cell surface glycoprotein 1-like [Atheta coriaria]|uniref:cell surface glycoprotein 1-like n=1 Tax=Dalotia coriaria TaxID=877792 RepID=UPI0031F448F4
MILKSAASVVALQQHECAPKSVTSTAASAAGEGANQRVARRVPIVDLNEHLTCFLCKGYFIDATTIIECLHSFCRGCIVKYLESNKYCPVCDVQVHKTKPLLNIRPDKILQDIVYKLVPKLYHNETQKRRDFYAAHPESKPSGLETRAEASYQHLLTPDEMLCISLMYNGAADKCTPRYLRCSASLSIWHLQKLIRNKYDLSVHHRVEILHQDEALAAYLTLMDVAYIYLWRRKVPLALTYRIYESTKKANSQSLNLSAENNNNNDSSGEEGWKEVQLRISENGEMSVTGIQDCLSLLDANILQDDKDMSEKSKKEKDTDAAIKASPSKKLKVDKKGSKDVKDTKDTKDPKRETRSALQVKNTPAEKSAKIPKERKRKSMDAIVEDVKNTDVDTSNKKSKLDELQSTLPACISITTKSPVILNHSLGLQNLSNNHPLKKHSLASTKPSTAVSLNSVTTVSPSTYNQTHHLKQQQIKTTTASTNAQTETSASVVTPSTLKVSTVSSSSTVKSTAALCTATTSSTCTPSASLGKHSPQPYAQFQRVYTPPSTNYTPINVPSVPNIHANRMGMSPAPLRHYNPRGQGQSPHAQRFKTMETSVAGSPGGKQWNQRPEMRPQTPPPPQVGSTNDLRNVRPAKFFKMRNNMPRYLGCPASGVKPMYQVQDSPEKADEKKESTQKTVKETKDDDKQQKDVKKSAPPATCTEIKRHSIVKIDPKTLKPIADRAPEMTSLTTYNIKPPVSSPQQDLKINTSSVSIFNPIKLQTERKSPHSPISKRPASSPTSAGNPPPPTQSQSPAMVTTVSSGAMPMSSGMMNMHAKHQKASLSYTPPNPYVPNLQSPTLNPNQFMYPSPAAFPPYDSMMAAAFLAYSRAPYNYDFHKMQMAHGHAPYSVQPLVMMSQAQPPTNPQPATPKKSKESKEKSTTRTSSPKTESPKLLTSKDDNNTKETTKVSTLKESKDVAKNNTNSTSNKPVKSDKSLQNALDKLTKAKMAGDGAEHKTETSEKPRNKNKIEIKSQITITSQGNVSSIQIQNKSNDTEKVLQETVIDAPTNTDKTPSNEENTNTKQEDKTDTKTVEEIAPKTSESSENNKPEEVKSKEDTLPPPSDDNIKSKGKEEEKVAEAIKDDEKPADPPPAVEVEVRVEKKVDDAVQNDDATSENNDKTKCT